MPLEISQITLPDIPSSIGKQRALGAFQKVLPALLQAMDRDLITVRETLNTGSSKDPVSVHDKTFN